jgi:hypothetical protein
MDIVKGFIKMEHKKCLAEAQPRTATLQKWLTPLLSQCSWDTRVFAVPSSVSFLLMWQLGIQV